MYRQCGTRQYEISQVAVGTRCITGTPPRADAATQCSVLSAATGRALEDNRTNGFKSLGVILPLTITPQQPPQHTLDLHLIRRVPHG